MPDAWRTASTPSTFLFRCGGKEKFWGGVASPKPSRSKQARAGDAHKRRQARPQRRPGAAPVAAAAAPAEEEVKKGPSEVNLILKGLGPTASKVAVIKAVQAITGLGLMDAKKLVDAAPSTIKEKISPVEAESHKKTLVDAGAEVEIK